MNEHEFRTVLRASMSVNPEPPPMGDGPVLDAAHRDRRRRRAMWAGAGTSAAVMAIVAGVVLLAPADGGDGGGGLEVANSQSTTTKPSTTRTDLAWPDGQTDQRETAGPENDKAVALLAELDGIVPDGYEAPDDLVGHGDLDGVVLKRHLAQYENGGPGVKAWSYHAVTPITKDGGVGKLEIRVVQMPPGLEVHEGCELSPGPACSEKVVDGKRVAVFSHEGQLAVQYRAEHVFVAIDVLTTYDGAGLAPLTGLPFTADQLAALVTDPRFLLD